MKKIEILKIYVYHLCIIMSNGYNVGNKTAFCRIMYGRHLNSVGYKITNLQYDCRYGDECRGCHNPGEFKILPHIPKWEKKDKSNVNLLEIKKSILQSFTEEGPKVKNPKYKSSIIHAASLQFNELLHYWFDITCYHRKIAKELKGKSLVEGYSNFRDVPKFYLPNEDDVWALERVIHPCETFKNMVVSKGQPYSVRDICVGHQNCKNGVHERKDLVCVQDLINGTCDCGPDTYTSTRTELLSKIEELKKSIIDSIDEDGFEIKVTKAMKTSITAKITEYQKQLASLKPRMIHYTEQGLKPLSVRIQEAEVSKPKEIDVEEIKTKTVRRVVKKKGKV